MKVFAFVEGFTGCSLSIGFRIDEMSEGKGCYEVDQLSFRGAITHNRGGLDYNSELVREI